MTLDEARVVCGPKSEGLADGLVLALGHVLASMSALGYPMRLLEGLRSADRQQQLYAQGRSAPGKIVTYADGVLKRSQHQSGRAADCAFRDDPRTPRDETYAEDMPWQAYGAAAEAVGLTWGGRWKMHDLPHVELKST